MNTGNILILTLTLILSACGNDSNYLYRETLPALESTSREVNVKEAITREKVDILWVIDNSISMREEQDDIQTNIDLFLQQFTQRNSVDWKMGLISTDLDERPYIGFDNSLDSSMPLPIAIQTFKMAVRGLGLDGATNEQSFAPVLNALNEYNGKTPYANTGTVVRIKPQFTRENSHLIIFIVTDELEDEGNKSNIAAQEFYDQLVQIKGGDQGLVKVYGAINAQDLGCSDESFKDYYGEKYEEIIRISGGSVFPACSSDFGEKLANVGGEIVESLGKPQIFLKERPIPSSIRIVYNPISREKESRVLPGGVQSTGGFWIYNPDSNAIEFHNLEFAPGDEEYVTISYDLDDGFDR